LGVEFVYTRQQRWLDRRQSGHLSDDDFLRRIHYDEEWGYAWSGYRQLLDRAAAHGAEVRALDAAPRCGANTLRQRDEHAARRIADVLRDSAETKLIVLFGETHLLPGHLPRRVETKLRRAGIERRSLIVFQNPDRVYWKAVEREPTLPEAVCVDDDCYTVFHTSPLEKYESYRQVLDRWDGDIPADEEVDLTPAVHHLIDVLLRETGIRSTRCRVKHRAGWSDDLVDLFPEVYSGPQAFQLLEPLLGEHRRSREELDEAARLLTTRGAVYDPRSNAIFLAGYLPGPAAGEAARFLRAALTGRLFIVTDDFADNAADAAYGAAFNEALAYLGSRLVDPTTDYLKPPPAEPAADGELQLWLDLHRRFEESQRARPPEALLDRMRRSRKLRRMIARDLGRRLGAVLFERVLAGRLAQADLRRLFGKRLVPSRAAASTLRLLRADRTDDKRTV
jgi:hypothetical protein